MCVCFFCHGYNSYFGARFKVPLLVIQPYWVSWLWITQLKIFSGLVGDQILFLLYCYKVIQKTVHRFLICLFANKKFDFLPTMIRFWLMINWNWWLAHHYFMCLFTVHYMQVSVNKGSKPLTIPYLNDNSPNMFYPRLAFLLPLSGKW